MPANLFCKTYRSIVVFTTIALLCNAVKAQKMYYSASESNLPAETKTYVVGKVASNIVIWKYMQETQKSQLLVYDENMNLRLRAKADIFVTDAVYQFNFIAAQNCFYVIAQLYKNRNFYCQVAKFNAAGDLMAPVKTLFTRNIYKTYYTGSYECIVSSNKKYLTLIKDKPHAPANEMQLDVLVYHIQDTLQAVAEKTISIPYYKDLHTQFSTLHLDNRGNLYFAQYVSQDKDTASHLTVYRSTPDNTSISSCVTDLANKQLTDIHIKLDNLKQQCIVYALWAPATPSATKPAGIFSWVVNERFEGLGKGMSYTLFGVDGQHFKTEDLSTKDIIVLNDNTCTVALTSNSRKQADMYADNYNIPEYNYINRASFSTSLYEASNPQVYQQEAVNKKTANPVENHSTDYVYIYNNNYNSTPRPVAKTVVVPRDVNASLLFLRINNKDNNVMWTENINSDHEANAFAFVNKYSLINSGEDLNFICKKIFTGDKESIENIRLDADGKITIQQIMFRNTDYDVLIDRGIQVDDRSMIFPCVYHDKTLAFARFELE
jgi:hypothetical protein